MIIPLYLTNVFRLHGCCCIMLLFANIYTLIYPDPNQRPAIPPKTFGFKEGVFCNMIQMIINSDGTMNLPPRKSFTFPISFFDHKILLELGRIGELVSEPVRTYLCLQ